MTDEPGKNRKTAGDGASRSVDRRTVLGAGAAGVLLGVTGRSAAQPEAPRRREHQSGARNVIFLVSDGMSAGTFALAEMMREVKGLGRSHWSRLWLRPDARRAMCDTRSADGWVTDSAAAGSAWGIGERVNNGAINFTPDGRMPEPVLATARSLGKATGLVTTTRLTHATPAAFIANVPKRSMEDEIAAQMLDRQVDALYGGGRKHFPDRLLDLHRGTVAAPVQPVSVLTAAGQLGVQPQEGVRRLGVFADDHLPYAIDRTDGDASLPAMSRSAVQQLERHTDGFVLQIEGGRVDHAAHDNDAAAMIADQIEFDEVVGFIAEWSAERDDTLVVVTTDHGNANPGLTYYGEAGVKSFERVAGATQSFERIRSIARASGAGFDGLVQAIHGGSGITLTDDEVGRLRRAVIDEERLDPFDAARGFGPVLGSLLANHTGVAFLSPNHTSDLVEVTAYGPGSERMPACVDNTSMHAMMLAALSPRYAPAW